MNFLSFSLARILPLFGVEYRNACGFSLFYLGT